MDIQNKINDVKEQIEATYDEIGLTESEKRREWDDFEVHIFNEYKKYEHQRSAYNKKLFKGIEDLGKLIYDKCQELHCTCNSNPCSCTEMKTYEPKAGLTRVIELDRELREYLSVLQVEESTRRKKYEKVQKEEKVLCEEMDEEQSSLNFYLERRGKIPSEKAIDDLIRTVSSLRLEKTHREKKFTLLRSSISGLLEECEEKPVDRLERDFMSRIEGSYALSLNNTERIKEMESRLLEKVQKMKALEDKLHSKIQILWERLEVDRETRDNFQESLPGKTVRDIPFLESELSHLEDLKRMNMGSFINKLRLELNTWWDKCFISEDEKEDFKPYFSDDYTDECLQLHEEEVARYRDFYAKNEGIYRNLDKWQLIWKKRNELEDRANNPNRLFGNRGGALLQEAKERKRVNNELPRIENEIRNQIEVAEAESQCPFLVRGQRLTEFLSTQWKEWAFQREAEKQERHEANSKQLKADARLGTTRAMTPNKRPNTTRVENLRNSKFIRTGDKDRTPVSHNKMNPADKQNNLRHHGGRTALSNKNSNSGTGLDGSQMPSYLKFSEQIHKLSERENMRSSVVLSSDQSFLVCNSPRKTPKRLPVIPNHMRPTMSSSRTSRPSQYNSPQKRSSYNRTRTPMTLPRVSSRGPRRSSRLDTSFRISPRQSTMRVSKSPYSSANITSKYRMIF